MDNKQKYKNNFNNKQIIEVEVINITKKTVETIEVDLSETKNYSKPR